MYRPFRLRVLLLLLAPACAPLTVSAQPEPADRSQAPFRHKDVDAAWRAAQQSGRPLLVFVTSGGCHFCEKMLSETLAHPQIRRVNNHRFETAKISADTRPELVEKLGVQAFPTTLLVQTDGTLAARLTGYAAPAQFAAKFHPSPKVAGRPRRPGRPSPR